MKGIVLLPSLNRAKLLRRFIKSYFETNAKIEGLILIDHNDPQKEEYLSITLPTNWRIVLTQGVKMGDKVREVWDQYKDYDAITILNDDHVCMTKEWDKKILSAINGHNVIATNDGQDMNRPWNAPNRICGAITFSGPIIRALGYIFPENLQHLYSDDVWGLLFGRAQCCQFLMDVCMFHDHAYFNEAKRDETYKVVNGDADWRSPEPKGGLWDSDREAFKAWLKDKAEADIQKVLDLQPKTGIMIATPTHDGNTAMGYALGLADAASFFASQNIYFEIARVQGSSLIPHARNSLVDMFLKSRCQKLLFIDSDQGFNRNHVFFMLNSTRRIVAGVTPHKRFPINLNFEPLEEDKKYFKDLNNKSELEFFNFVKEKADPKGEIEVNRSGTGFICIDRSVFKIMKEHINEYLAFDQRDDVRHGEYFWMGYEKEAQRFRGEDWNFCELAKKLNIPIYINTNTLVSHHGSYTFEINEALRQSV